MSRGDGDDPIHPSQGPTRTRTAEMHTITEQRLSVPRSNAPTRIAHAVGGRRRRTGGLGAARGDGDDGITASRSSSSSSTSGGGSGHIATLHQRSSRRTMPPRHPTSTSARTAGASARSHVKYETWTVK
ncbi:hypothetical protein PCL_11938 [Purpureocillium lilacinum]|uniref:Uncharacterized protein n=1 Tax=Purpureocillium lilacinum TaxID=33203 RepID=A0A2U3EBD8_PURLI|nr:hypothetical protein Purlil1_6238 [Purpureocillium lilacinum]PWI71844.1 hypothetical protein PCL_11938 [Purpureocillium lilacinum]